MAITLKAARINVKLNQKDAAEAIGVSVDTLSNWENNKTYPSVPQIKKIEEIYKIAFKDIIFLNVNSN